VNPREATRDDIDVVFFKSLAILSSVSYTEFFVLNTVVYFYKQYKIFSSRIKYADIVFSLDRKGERISRLEIMIYEVYI